jgi:hypothetical protein
MIHLLGMITLEFNAVSIRDLVSGMYLVYLRGMCSLQIFFAAAAVAAASRTATMQLQRTASA